MFWFMCVESGDPEVVSGTGISAARVRRNHRSLLRGAVQMLLGLHLLKEKKKTSSKTPTSSCFGINLLFRC